MAVYLVDFENVTSAGISGIQRLTKEDKVYIFYTVNASNMSFAAHMNLLSSPAEVIYYNVASGGKNALDFQLASFLGYLISQGEDKDFYIISNDRGYDHVKSFWERSGIAQGVTINSSPSINRSLLPPEKPFTAKIQQQNQQPSAPLQGSVSSSALEQLKAEADRYTAQKAAREEQSAEAVDLPAEEEKPAPKKRGRPKKQKSEETAAEKPADTPKKTAASAGKAKKKPKEKAAPDTLTQAVKPLLAKAGVSSEEEIDRIASYLKRADGKQQFYRNLIALYGMERGVEVYRAVRSEYNNLTKLVKQ